MKSLCLAFTALFFGSFALAQQNGGAQVDFTYLQNVVVPNYDEKTLAFEQFKDSLRIAYESDPVIIALEEEVKNKDSEDRVLAEQAYKSQEELIELQNEATLLVNERRQAYFGNLDKLGKALMQVLEQSEYDFLFLNRANGDFDVFFKDLRIQNDYGQRIYKCAVAKGRESGQLDLMNQGSLSEAQMAIADQLMIACRKELLVPLLVEGADLTQAVEEVLKN